MNRADGRSSLAAIRRSLRAHANPEAVALAQSFFKTGPGEYGEGDVFIGVRVPDVRSVARVHRGAALETLLSLLVSRVHEDRLLALVMLVEAFQRGDAKARRAIFDAYLRHTAFINNWDLVDCSAPAIVGGFLADRDRGVLTTLARSSSLWERRIAIVATHHYIRRGEFDDTLRVADMLLSDPHDLIHKAVGWMLREVGKRDRAALRRFLETRHGRMPRTMVRYAIERFPDAERRRYLLSRASAMTTSSIGESTPRSSGRKSASGMRKPKP